MYMYSYLNSFYMMGFTKREFILGNYYYIGFIRGRARCCKFIKVTPKGFNFLDVSTSKCVFTKHFYAPKYSGRDIPRETTRFTVWIPGYTSAKIRS